MKVKSFKAESGISFEVKGQWYKLYSGIEVLVEDGDVMEDVKRKAWNTVNTEIEKQVKDILE